MHRNCLLGWTSRCLHSQLLGSPNLPGAQAQYVRIPEAGGTLIPIVTLSSHLRQPLEFRPDQALLLADILPNGLYAAKQAFQHPNQVPILNATSNGLGFIDKSFQKEIAGVVVTMDNIVNIAIIGLGPVGLVGSCNTRVIRGRD